ncbi:hypothetical protein [Photobacterium kishitanii]|uniref:hypothetical protein n=1 Tax=Photobacterium kishitanii TaxID=318456 RepID=UPI00273A24D0|nr:hypothetical protein [Photobacterium kishitanii]
MMNSKKCVYSYLLIYFISASLFADELSEAFIEIKTNERYDSFFRVLLDDETPYLNISTLLPLLYGLDRKCDSERCHYFIALRPNDGQTTINFKEKHCNSTTNKKYIILMSIILKNNIGYIGKILPFVSMPMFIGILIAIF